MQHALTMLPNATGPTACVRVRAFGSEQVVTGCALFDVTLTRLVVTENDQREGERSAIVTTAKLEASAQKRDVAARRVIVPPLRVPPRRHETNDYGAGPAK